MKIYYNFLKDSDKTNIKTHNAFKSIGSEVSIKMKL